MSFLLGLCVLGTLLFLVICCFIYGRGGFRFSIFVATLYICVLNMAAGDLGAVFLFGFFALLQGALYQTFFIHGMYRSPDSPGLSRDRFEANGKAFASRTLLKFLKVHLVFATVHSVVFIIQIVYLKKWYELIEAFGLIVVIYCLWLIIGLLTTHYYFLLIRHFAIKRKYVISVPSKSKFNNIQLFGIRYWYQKRSRIVHYYAYENVFGDVYYRRLAKTTDKSEACDTALIRFFERSQEPFQKRIYKLRVRYLFVVLFIVTMTVLSFSASNTKEMRQYFNQSFFARDYVPKQGRVDHCEQVKRNSSRYTISTTYSFYCEVTSLEIVDKYLFSFTDELRASLNRQEMLENGVVVYHDPKDITNFYILEDAENTIADFYGSILLVVVLDGIIIFCWVILHRQIKAK